jgi:hypothetical protein
MMKKYLTLVLPLLVFSFIFAQDEADTPEAPPETATDAAEESIEVEEEKNTIAAIYLSFDVNDSEQVKNVQKILGLTVDGMFGHNTAAAYEAAVRKIVEQQPRAEKESVEEDDPSEATEETPAEAAEEAVEPEAETATDAPEESIEVEEEIIFNDFSDFDEEEEAAGKTSPIIGVSLNGGLPIYSASYLSSYTAGFGGGLTLHTNFGFNVGSLSFTTDVNILYVDYSDGDDSGLKEFSNLGVFAQISSNTSDLLSFIPTPTSIHFGAGFLPGNGMGFNAGGGLELPLNLPVGIGLVGNATISQTSDDQLTGWLSAGLGISKTF